MIQPDDPRHGENRGYIAGCRQDCCRRPHMVQMKKYRLNGGGRRMVPAVGTIRRIRALEAIGWSLAEQSRRFGKQRDYLKHTLSREYLYASTANAFARFYDELSMTVPMDPPDLPTGVNRVHELTRKRARALGYAPPLAWDDDTIDDPNARPNLDGFARGHSAADHAVVQRLLAGERVQSSRAEKEAAMSQWLASGRPERLLCDIHGWKAGRYVPRNDEGDAA